MGPHDVSVRVRYDELQDKIVLDLVDEMTEVKDLITTATRRCRSEHVKDKESLKECVTTALMKEVDRIGTSVSWLKRYRGRMSERFRDYTCQDDGMESSNPLRTLEYHHLDRSYEMNVHLDTENAKIWTIPDFVTPEECDALIESTKDKLEKASTVGSDGELEYSTARKAQQATYPFHRHLRSDRLWYGYLFHPIL